MLLSLTAARGQKLMMLNISHIFEVHLCFNFFLQLMLNIASKSSLPNFLFWIGRIEEILKIKIM